MGLFSLRREIKDAARFREIVTILVKQGFHQAMARAELKRFVHPHAHLAKECEITPERVRETLELLGPTFVKLGQILSLRPDLVPHEYCEEFKLLQDHLPPLSYPVIKGVIESELRAPLAKLFKSFDHEPLAAASVAQVHAAVLHDGRRVVVKVQRPGVRDVMAADIDLMSYIVARLDRHHAALRFPEIVAEFKSYAEKELDFSHERRNLHRFRDAFKDDPLVVIPEPFDSLSTSRLLVMERIEGTPLSDKEALRRHGFSLSGLARIGLRCIVAQVFTHGFFHGDPHPGNLVAVKRGGREALAFLDFGIVGFIDEETRTRFLELFDALFRKDIRGVGHLLLRIGTRQPGCDLEALERVLSPFILEYHDTTLGEERLSSLIYRLIQLSSLNGIPLPANVVLTAKAFVTMEGSASWLDPELNLTRELAPFITEYFARRYAPARLKAEAFRDLRELHHLTRDLPVAAETLMAKIAEGKLSLTLDEGEFRRVERLYDLETSKRSLALVTAGFFVGSALIAGLASTLSFLGFPLYYWGFLLFLITLLLFIRLSGATHKYVERR